MSLHTEIQYRHHTIIPNNAEQLLLRAGINYNIDNQSMLSIGYAFIPSYYYGSEQSSPEVKESRVWQQFILKNKIGRIAFEHRYRIEQRWSNTFKTRFRYRVFLTLPLSESETRKKSFFISAYNEVFINGQKDFFDRNRLYGALGYHVNRNINIQSGAMTQLLKDTKKTYFQLSITYNIDLTSARNE